MRPTRLLALSLCALLAPAPHAALADPRPTPFAAAVAGAFDRWDSDHDGVLSPAEIDALVVAPGVKGEEAAAVAAIKLMVRSGRYALPPLTRDYLTAPTPPIPPAAPAPARTPKPPTPPAGPDARTAGPGEHDTDFSTPPASPAPAATRPPFESRFARALKRIQTTKRDLALDDTPDLDQCHQGPLGDCFFVSVVGAMVARDPGVVKAMIAPAEGGGYSVTLPGREPVRVEPLTDAELAVSSTTGDEGLWLPILEKAYGQVRQSARPEATRTLTATDAIAKGGSSATVIRALTGHRTRHIKLLNAAAKPVPDPTTPTSTLKDARPPEPRSGPKPLTAPSDHARTASAADVAELVARVKEAAGAALREKRLVTAGTPSVTGLPRGLTPNHAYAVLAIDESADTLRLWNPHGQTFTPRGEPGMTNGYPTRAGVFTMPLPDFVRAFGGMSIELPASEKSDAADKSGTEKPARAS
jgi:hypothetical protein